MRTIAVAVMLIAIILLVGELTPSDAFSTGSIHSLTTLRSQGVNEVNRLSQHYRAPTTTARSTQRTITQQYMAPRFDSSTEKWIPASQDETVSSAGYGPFGTLLRQGPKPFLIRLSNTQNYEQGVYKLMAGEKWEVLEAMANFDAYLENPNDWAYQYFQEKKGAVAKKDYVNGGMDVQSLVLKGTWTTLVLGAGARALYCYSSGENFYQPLISLLSKQ